MADVESLMFNRRLIDDNTGCWNWTGSFDASGYGRMTFEGRTERVHRIAAHLWLGYDFDQPVIWSLREHVLHHCNNRRCFNPEHLYVGDNRDNSADARKAGTTSKPTLRKLTDEQVNEIRHLQAEGFTQRQIVKMVDFKTNTQTISFIKRGLYYADVKESK